MHDEPTLIDGGQGRTPEDLRRDADAFGALTIAALAFAVVLVVLAACR